MTVRVVQGGCDTRHVGASRGPEAVPPVQAALPTSPPAAAETVAPDEPIEQDGKL